jgi:hypothetical protein
MQELTDRVSAYSLAQGKRLWERLAQHEHMQEILSMHSLASFEDHDRDGAIDVLVGIAHWHLSGPVPKGGKIELLSGRTGEPIWSVGDDRYASVLCESIEPK